MGLSIEEINERTATDAHYDGRLDPLVDAGSAAQEWARELLNLDPGAPCFWCGLPLGNEAFHPACEREADQAAEDDLMEEGIEVAILVRGFEDYAERLGL